MTNQKVTLAVNTRMSPDGRRIREWLNEMQPGETFFRREAPGNIRTVRYLLGVLAADPAYSGIKRLTRGFYIKGEQISYSRNGEQISYWVYDTDRHFQILEQYFGVGRGLGIAGPHAANLLGWGQKPSAKEPEICMVADRNLVAPLPGEPKISRRANKRRRTLTPAEVTMLEAASSSPAEPQQWEECLQTTTDDIDSLMERMHRKLALEHLVVKAAALTWAAENEHRTLTRERTEELASCMPEVVVW